MKANILVLFPLLVGLGCNSRQNDQLSQQQKDQIVKEVRQLNDSSLASWQRLDGEHILKYYHNSPDWMNFDADGSNLDYQTFKKAVLEFGNIASSYKATTLHENYIVLTKDIVIGTWVYKDVVTLKSGDKITYDPHPYTALVKKIAGQWKVVYCHNSGTPVMQKTAKK